MKSYFSPCQQLVRPEYAQFIGLHTNSGEHEDKISQGANLQNLKLYTIT